MIAKPQRKSPSGFWVASSFQHRLLLHEAVSAKADCDIKRKQFRARLATLAQLFKRPEQESCPMMAFEIRVNDRLIQTVGVGERGPLEAAVHWSSIDTVRGTTANNSFIRCSGLQSNHGNAMEWPNYYLELTDEVTIRLVERDLVEVGEEIPLTRRPPQI